jgi:hypothetical protein
VRSARGGGGVGFRSTALPQPTNTPRPVEVDEAHLAEVEDDGLSVAVEGGSDFLLAAVSEIPLGWGPKGREFKSRRPD